MSFPTNGRLRSAEEHRSNSPAIKASIILIISFNSEVKCLKHLINNLIQILIKFIFYLIKYYKKKNLITHYYDHIQFFLKYYYCT